MKYLDSASSVQHWIDVAKRAVDLLARVDLDRVARHDPHEVAKLEPLTGALRQLGDGSLVGFVPGVDVDEIPELDPEQIRLAKLTEILVGEGLGDRLGRVFMMESQDGEPGAMRPLDCIPHRHGLPEFLLCVAPDFAPLEGAHGIFVSERGVFAAIIPEPMTRHRWRIARSRPFDDEREMVASVHRFIDRDAD
ncbi:MAG TPA: hypothetical protein VF210_21250 [Pseudomonadales bacterium]